jgi:hypothetical protein
MDTGAYAGTTACEFKGVTSALRLPTTGTCRVHNLAGTRFLSFAVSFICSAFYMVFFICLVVFQGGAAG